MTAKNKLCSKTTKAKETIEEEIPVVEPKKTRKSPTKKKKPIRTLEELKAELLGASKGITMEQLLDEEPGILLESSLYDLNRILSGNLFKSMQTKNHIGIIGPEACLDEDTHIHFETWVNGERHDHKGGKIKNLWKHFHKGDKEFKIMSINENDCVFGQNIVDVVKTGIKRCYQLTTAENHKIITSKDHKFYTGYGEFLPLEELNEGDIVYVHTNLGDSSYPEEIKSIVNVGERNTYDIKCAYPYNNYIANNIVVHNSGKSSIMALMLASAQKEGFLPVVIDAEGAWTKDFVTRWGIDDTNILKLKSMWVGDIMVNLTEWINNGYERMAIAIDSIGALDVKKVLTDGEKGDVKADQGRLQKDIKRMLKLIVNLCKNHDCICFSAGHYYGNPSGYGEPEMIGGGKYYRLSCDQIISLKKSNIFENPSGASRAAKGKIIGNKIKAATLKNRYHPPFQEAVIEIDYQNGVNSLAGIIDLAMELGMITKSGAWYVCPSLGLNEQGAVKLMNALKTKDLAPMLKQINDHLSTTGYSSVNMNLEMSKDLEDQK